MNGVRSVLLAQPYSSEMDLAGLEPAASWVRSAVRRRTDRRPPLRPRLRRFELRRQRQQLRLARRPPDDLHAQRQPVGSVVERQ